MLDSGYEFTDVFCGAGGSSSGLAAAGLRLRLAANHWPTAIESHAANFTDAEHLCADVNNYDMRRLPSTHILWASPICTELSPSGGRKKARKKPTRGQLLMLEEQGHVPSAGYERTRATFWDVIRATEVHRYPIVIIENVVEAYDWELFDVWLAGMDKLGYHHQLISVNAAHIYDDSGNDPAPQWRDRLYVFFTRLDLKPLRIEPRPAAWCFDCGELVQAVQSWKRQDRPKVGKYGQQYVYRCPNTGCRHSVVEPYVLPAAAAIDWTDLGTRLGDRAKPLADATLRRIRVGIEMFAQPVEVAVHGQTFERPGYTRAWPINESPTTARSSTPGDGLACPPHMISVNHDDGIDRAYEVDARPLPTRSTKIGDGLVCPPFVVKHYTPRNSDAQMVEDPQSDPLGSVTASLNQSVVQPFLLDRRYQAEADPKRLHDLHDPFQTVVAGGHSVRTLVVPAGGTWRDRATSGEDEPMPARTASESDGLFTPPLVGELRNNSTARPAHEAPVFTIAAGGNHAYVATPGAFIQKHHGSVDYGPIQHMVKDVRDPLATVVTQPNLSLVIPYRKGRAKRAATDPMLTVATRTSAGLATPGSSVSDDELADCYFRMLKPREHGRAQRFRDTYIVVGNVSEQTMQFGNAVASNVAQWLGGWAARTLDGAA